MLNDILMDNGYDVQPALSGSLALTSIQKCTPDLILLDILMPIMSGYEVCSLLKADPHMRDIPVIFVSALTEPQNRIKGFKLGAVDYITKPFQLEEVLARVETQLANRFENKKLRSKNMELTKAAQLRDEIECIAQHDLKGPLSAIVSLPKNIKKRGNLNEYQTKGLDIIEKAGHRMLDLLNHYLSISRMESGKHQLKMVPVDIVQLVHSITDELQGPINSRNVSVHILINKKPTHQTDSFIIQGDETFCYYLLGNLIKNAVEASSTGQSISVFLDHDETISIQVHNKAVVPENIRSTFFEKFTSEGKQNGHGIGTYSARLAAEAQGASISLKTSIEKGTTVSILFPKESKDLK